MGLSNKPFLFWCLHIAQKVGQSTPSLVCTMVNMKPAVSWYTKLCNLVSYKTSLPVNQIIWLHTSEDNILHRRVKYKNLSLPICSFTRNLSACIWLCLYYTICSECRNTRLLICFKHAVLEISLISLTSLFLLFIDSTPLLSFSLSLFLFLSYLLIIHSFSMSTSRTAVFCIPNIKELIFSIARK